MSLLSQALAVVTDPTGSAIYHIVTLFALEAAFAIALGHRLWMGPGSNATRLAVAGGLSGAGRAVLLALGTLAAGGLLATSPILPPLDRAVSLATMLLMSWALLGRRANRWADALTGLGLTAVLIGAIAAGIQWYEPGASGAPYNSYDVAWELAKLAVIVLSLLAFLALRPDDWGLTVGLFATLLAGVAYHLLEPAVGGNYPAPERLAELAALPLFAVIAYRQSFRASVPPSAVTIPTHAASTTKYWTSLKPEAAAALAALARAGDEDLAPRVAEAVGRTLVADLTLTLTPPAPDGAIMCAAAFDLIRETHLPGFMLPPETAAELSSAMTSGRPVRLRPGDHDAALTRLAEALSMDRNGPAMMAPLIDGEKNVGAVLVFSAYGGKDWSDDDRALLVAVADPITAAVARAESDVARDRNLAESADRVGEAEADTRAARGEVDRLLFELHQARDEIRRVQQRAESLTAIIQAGAAGGPPAEALAEEIELLRSSYHRALEELAEVNQDLADAQGEIGRLQDQQRPTAGPGSDMPPAEDAAAELLLLQTSYRRALEDMAALNQVLSAAQAEIEQLREEQGTAAEAQRDGAAADWAAELDALRASHDGALTRLALLDRRLVEANAEIERLRGELQSRAAAGAESEAEGAADLARLQSHYRGALAEIAVLSQQLAEARAETERWQSVGRLAEESGRDLSVSAEAQEVDDLTQRLVRAQTEIGQISARLREAEEKLATAPSSSALQSQVAVLISLIQEMRQPLSAIVGYTDLLLGESVGIVGALQRTFLERIKASTERMTTTLDDLLQVAAIDTGTLTLDQERVEVSEVIEDAFTGIVTQFREKGISLRMDIADELPSVEADHDALYQIISRLLANACAASDPNSEVILTARVQSDEFLLISVRDCGGGIDPGDQAKVFARFYRADRPLIQGLGDTGVGLSIAKVLTEAQGGRIWVESEMGSGSTFSVLLPVHNHR